MWILTNNTGNVLIVISEKSKYTVGRVGADLVITDDSSISRTHAFLHITTKQTTGDTTKEILELEDACSKYGTFHNGSIEKGASLPKHKRIVLADGDRIRFGVLKSLWTVSNKTPIVAISALPDEMTNQLKQLLPILGGCILPNFEESYNHLTLKEINVTSKLLHALLDQKPIVTCDYWCNLVQAARRGRRLLPQIASYMPPNPHNFDIEYREARKTVFKNLTFVFLHARHFNTYACIVEKAGGTSKHLNVGLQKSFLIRKDVVVVHYVPSMESQSSQTISTIEDYLKLHSRRTVPEYEIAMAIISCSTTRHCNPSYKVDDETSQATKSNDTDVLQSTIQRFSSHTNLSDTLGDEETEVFIPETDRKSTASTHLTDKSSVGLSTPRVDQINSIHSQIFETRVSNSNEEVMSSHQITESEQEVNKRKRTRGKRQSPSTVVNTDMDSDEDELFNFATKKAHVEERKASPIVRATRQQRKSNCSPLDENASTSAAATSKQTPKSCGKELPIAINKKTTRKTVINMSGFLEKTHAPIQNMQKPNADVQNISIQDSLLQKGVKRARVAIIDNSDDDDLFCFGGKSHTNEDSSSAKRARPGADSCDSDESDLFNFGCGDDDEQNDLNDEIDGDSCKEPMIQKEKFHQIVMPKPKPLPAKICVADWLDCSLSALSIKSEQVKDALDTEKKENNDSGVEGDGKDEPIKGGCVITVLSTKTLMQERDVRKGSMMQNNQGKEYNSTTKNFKKFTKFMKERAL
ncbi:nibrin isoform X2 [Ceratitis capitata]|uniref:Nibrin n=1 Tax=Ceratitis capitata TaxID=7213 RepID=W8B674_CERCA|nr:nibrin isoform X2 [Ceratitis capitata]